MTPILLERLRKEPLLLISVLLAVVSSFFTLPRAQAVDWPVLIALFNLMVVLSGLELVGLFDSISVSLLQRVTGERGISLVLVASTFVASMLITNDVALLTFVPLAILVAQKAGFNPAFIIILQTIAANVGSSLTPVGNPQNLFLYAAFGVPLLSFLKTMIPFVLVGGVWLIALQLRLSNEKRTFELQPTMISDTGRMLVWLTLFGGVLFSILRGTSQAITLAATVAVALLVDRKALRAVDYSLLGTFLALFVFVDNLARVPAVASWMQVLLEAPRGPYWAGIGFSQLISNVPAAVLLAGFTEHWPDLLLGVSVGGLGTLIASMASVISYRLYARAYPQTPYLGMFHKWNVLSLVVLGLVTYWLS